MTGDDEPLGKDLLPKEEVMGHLPDTFEGRVEYWVHQGLTREEAIAWVIEEGELEPEVEPTRPTTPVAFKVPRRNENYASIRTLFLKEKSFHLERAAQTLGIPVEIARQFLMGEIAANEGGPLPPVKSGLRPLGLALPGPLSDFTLAVYRHARRSLSWSQFVVLCEQNGLDPVSVDLTLQDTPERKIHEHRQEQRASLLQARKIKLSQLPGIGPDGRRRKPGWPRKSGQ